MFRPEHPNPQFVRRDWLNLNGLWDCRLVLPGDDDNQNYSQNGFFDRQINLPFCPESKLSGIGYTGFINKIWYRKRFVLPENWQQGRVFLRFFACDRETSVFVNSRLCGTHIGGYTPFSFDITAFLRIGENEIVVCASDKQSDIAPSGKQSSKEESFGCFYTRTTGIWQTVILEHTPQNYIESFKVDCDIEASSAVLTVITRGFGKLTAKVFYENMQVGERFIQAENGANRITIELSELHLWESGKGRLYDLQLEFGDDKVSSYFGMRVVGFDKNGFRLNGKPLFLRMVLDQGFYPDGIYTAPSEEALINDIRISQNAGFNGARLHQKIFEPRFLYHCDKSGYMVFGEYPDWGFDHAKSEAFADVINEWSQAISRDYNHPSIIGRCPLNEVWDGSSKLTELLYTLTKQLDNSRPCIDVSGGKHIIGEICDLHDYEQDVNSFKSKISSFENGGNAYENYFFKPDYPRFPIFMSEYGGIQWSLNNGWGYGKAPQSIEEFLARYKGLTEALLQDKNVCGFCYTQLYDVEQEQNGLYSYERVAKFDMSIIRNINIQKAECE